MANLPTLSASRRYFRGVIGVALVGVAMMGVYVWWSTAEIRSANEIQVEERARNAGESYRRKLELALVGRDPKNAATWTRLDPELEEKFESLPNLLGIVVRLPNGTPAAVIGPQELQSRPFLPVPAGRDDVSVGVAEDSSDQSRVTVSFHVRAGADPSSSGHANVHLQFVSNAGFLKKVLRGFQFGAVLVVVVIYLLAALAFVIGHAGRQAENLEREKAVRLKAIGEVAGAIAHELRNPLNAISLSFQVIGENLRGSAGPDGQRAGDLERARAEVQKISKVVDNFVSFARLSDLNMTDLDVAEVAREAFDEVAYLATTGGVTPAFQASGPTRLRGDRNKLREAFTTTLAAVLDALKARPGTLDVALVGTKRGVTVTVRGLAERVDSRRLSNFASTRRAWDEPVGLALTIARTWIDCHGGEVSGAQGGTSRAELVIVLPKRIA
jgi:signal transduction histidine kinase